MMEALAKEYRQGLHPPSFRRREGMSGSKKRYPGYEAVLGTIKAGKSSRSRFLCDLAFSLGPLLLDRSLPSTQGVG